MATARRQSPVSNGNTVYAEPSGSAPNVEPFGANWEYERLTSGLHGSIQNLTMQAGKVESAVTRNTTDICEVRSEIKELKEKSVKAVEDNLSKLDTTVKEHLSFVRGARWVIGLGSVAIVAILSITWTAVIQPGIAKAIADQIKPDISAQIKEALDAHEQKAALNPKTAGKK